MTATYRYAYKGHTHYVTFAPKADHTYPDGATDITLMSDNDINALEAEEQAASSRRINAALMLDRAMRRQAANTAEFSTQELSTLASAGSVMLEELFDKWTVGQSYDVDKRLVHSGRLYEVATPVTAEAHQPPDAAGMLAVYRLIDPATGTADDPKTLAVGMAVELGLHYRYNGAVYRLAREMTATVTGHMPGDPGMETFWVAI